MQVTQAAGNKFAPLPSSLSRLGIYYKKGNDYAFRVYDVESNPVENYTRNQYKKRSDEEALMTYKQFVNYLYAELYLDDRYKQGGMVAPNGKPSNL